MKRPRCAPVLIALATLALSACGPSQRSTALDGPIQDYDEGRYALAYREFLSLADAGDARGHNGLGVLYANGLGVERDDGEAVRWFRQGAERGFATAAFVGGSYVSRMYGLDQGFDRFRETQSRRIGEAVDGALRWLEKRGDEPFFLFLHGYDPHAYDPPVPCPDLLDPRYRGPAFARGDVTDAIERIIATDVALRRDCESFLDALDRLGLEPFKQGAYSLLRKPS